MKLPISEYLYTVRHLAVEPLEHLDKSTLPPLLLCHHDDLTRSTYRTSRPTSLSGKWRLPLSTISGASSKPLLKASRTFFAPKARAAFKRSSEPAAAAATTDHEEWRALNEAFRIVGFTDEERLNMLRIVTAVLHIGWVRDLRGQLVRATMYQLHHREATTILQPPHVRP
ncbi:hypothetical protein V8E36_002165 [Tilletia maclaganii]